MLDVQLPQTVTAVVLLVVLPFAVGLVAGLFLRALLRSLLLLLKLTAVVAVVLLFLGLIRPDALGDCLHQLWDLAGQIRRDILPHLFERFAGNPVVIASFVIGVAVGVFAREAWYRRAQIPA